MRSSLTIFDSSLLRKYRELLSEPDELSCMHSNQCSVNGGMVVESRSIQEANEKKGALKDQVATEDSTVGSRIEHS
jgi:hypothetical protein